MRRLAERMLALVKVQVRLIEWLLERIPEERVGDTILFDPSDYEHPYGLNLLGCDDRDDPLEVRWVVSTVMGTLKRMFEHSWGPRLEHVLGNALWTTMKIPDLTIIELLLLLTDEDFRKEKTKILKDKDQLLIKFWKNLPTNDRQLYELISSTVKKLTPFLLDPSMRNIVGQTNTTLDLPWIMNERKILLVNLAKGKLGENNSSLLGSVLINLILIAALQRHDMSIEEREQRPFHLIVDEYQNFASESFSVLQSEARKYAVDLVVAHQFRDQLSKENQGSSLNVGNFVFFRVTGTDGPDLATQYDNTPPPADLIWEAERHPSNQYPGMFTRGTMDQLVPGPRRLYSDILMQTANDLANLIPYRARARVLDQDAETNRPILAEHIIDTLNPDDPKYHEKYFGIPDKLVADRVIRYSRSKATPRKTVEAEIIKRIGKDTTMYDEPTATSEPKTK